MTEELIDRLRAMYVANGTNYVQAAADKLEAQAERIKFLEADRNLEKKMRKDADEYADTLRAQLAEIEEAEPVLVVEKEPDYWSGGHFHEGSKSHIGSTKVWRLPIGTKLFTRHMPAEIENVEPVAIALNTGTRQAVKWLQNIPHGEKLYTRPMPVQSAEHCLWARNGHEPCQHVKPSQDVTELVELLEFMWRDVSMNDYAFEKLEAALSKYKGVK